MPPSLLLTDIALTFGGTPLLAKASLLVEAGDRLCLVGRNGSGKSTLLKIAAGLVEPDAGTRFLQPGCTLRYLSQEPDFTGHSTTLSYVESGLGPGDDPYQARYLLEQLGLSGTEHPASLSGGEARRVALAGVLAPHPDILLLDEPTNHLDLPTIEWLEGHLQSLSSALVIISHDRRFMETLSQRTVWLDRGETRLLDAGFAAFESWRDTLLEQEEQEYHKLGRKIAAEEHWVRYGVTARRKRNVRRMEELRQLKDKRRTTRRVQGEVSLSASEGQTSGRQVIEAHKISFGYPNRPIVRDLSLRLQRGDRLVLAGPNGAGKTTLLRLLTGTLTPDSGTVKLGSNLESAILEQDRDTLLAYDTLGEALTQGRGDMVMVNGQPRHVASYMQDFLFSPQQIRTPVSVLSGGERARLMLARALAQPSNLLVLDEPTNDLDLETLDVLEDMLSGYQGTLILISHDRDFLDRIATHILVPEGDGRWQLYAGGYSDMLAQRREDVRRDRRPDDRKPPPPSTPSAQKPASRKLSFKDQHALDTLPNVIAALEQEIARLQLQLSDPDLFGTHPALFQTLSQTLATTQHRLEEAENQWLELELRASQP